MNRILAVTKMHLVDRVTLFVIPLGILLSSFLVNVTIWQFVPVEGRNTGGAAATYCFVLAAAMFAVIRGLPFALGMGASRRAFTLGTGLLGLVLAVVLGTLYLVLQGIERATDGWWMHGHFFYFPWFEGSPWVVSWLLFVTSFAAIFLLGAWLAAFWARWGTVGLAVGGPLAIIVAGAAAVLLTSQHSWGALWSWLGGLTPITTTAWTALLVVALSAATWGTLRRVRAA